MSELFLHLFGPVLTELDGEIFDNFRSTKAQALLLYLAAEPGEHQRAALMELLWPGLPGESARTNLRQVVYQLRKAIPEVDSRDGGEPVPLLFSERQTVQLSPTAAVATDVDEFDTLLEAVRAHKHGGVTGCDVCRKRLAEAVALYEGSFLEDFYLEDSDAFEAWAQRRRDAYRRQVLDALAMLADAGLKRGAYAAAEDHAHRQLELDRLDERAVRQLMEALARDGRKREALAVYDEASKGLRDELGMAPAAQTTRLAGQIENDALDEARPRRQAVRGYKLLDEVGSGAFGVVHRAYQPVVGREVVIKIIRPRYANHPDFIRRFEAEAQTIARLEHPYIVPLYDYWREPDNAYLVMRWLRGGNLEERLREGPLSPDMAAGIVDQLAAALYAAHRRHIIHRDVKAANILLDEDGNAYLSDFSVAKDLLTDEDPFSLSGSVEYLSPEQLLKEELSPQTDQYSLGIVIYQMLTGGSPFIQGASADVMRRYILSDSLPLIASKVPGMPREIDDVLQRATAKKPGDRYPDMIALARAFHRAVGTSGVTVSAGDDGRVGEAVETEAAVVLNPYKGLHAFQESDAGTFFGRETLVANLVERLQETGALSRFLVVVGPSGGGKSSAVKAGLIPALRDGAIPGSENWFITEMTPGRDPMEELAMALGRVAVDPPANLKETLLHDERGLARALERILPLDEGGETPQLLLLVDQFEELFTLTTTEEARDFFISSLLAALGEPHSRLRAIATLRADFYDRPLQVQALGELLRQRTEVVLPLSPAELEQAITKPAELAGVALEAGLLAGITADVSDQPGTLPLMQYALTELFGRREEDMMTVAAYQDIGGVSGALGRRADEIYQGLSPTEQEAARQIFLRLVTLGEGAEDTRRRALRAELEAVGVQSTVDSRQPTANDQQSTGNGQQSDIRVSAAATSDIASVIDTFGQYRLLTFDRDPITRGPTVEVAHEALLREWHHLCEWLDESRADVRLQRLLAAETAGWQRHDKDPSYLLRGARLDQYSGWPEAASVSLTEEEKAFLTASFGARDARLAEEEARRQRELETAQQLAETEKQRAEEQEAAAEGMRRRALFLAGALAIAVLLAVAAIFFANQSNQNAAVAEENAALAATREAEALTEADARATSEVIADAARKTAEEQAQIAFSRELAAAAIANLDKDPERSVLLAMQALREARTQEAEEALHRSLPELRVLQTFVGHEDQVWELDFNRDGSRLVTASRDGVPRIWDTTTGETLLLLSGCEGESWSAVYSDDGQMVAAACDFGSIKVWDATTGEIRHSLDGHRDSPNRYAPGEPTWVNSVAISPDSKLIATSGADGFTRLWDAATGAQLATYTIPDEKILGIAGVRFSPDGSALGMKGYGEHYTDSILQIIDLDSGSELATIYADPVLGIGAYRFSPDGSRLLLGDAGVDEKVILWDLEKGEEVARYTVGDNSSFDFSPDGSLFATQQPDGGARLWETETGREVLKLSGHSDRVEDVQFSPDGTKLATASDDGTARLWDIGPAHEVLTLRPFGDAGSAEVSQVAFSPDGTMLAAGGLMGGVSLWDAATGENLRTLAGHDDYVGGLFFSPDGARLASAGDDQVAKVWDLETGDLLLTLEGHEGWVNNLAYSPDGATIATIGEDARALIWDADDGRILHDLPLEEEGWGITYSPDSALLATGLWRAPIAIWDVETGELVREIDNGLRSADDVHFTPDGSKLVAGGMDGSLTTWDVATGVLLDEIKAHQSAAWGSAVSPDGTVIASVSGDRTARLWDIETGERLLNLEGHEGALIDVEFSPDGAHLATTGDDTIRVWALALDELVAIAKSRLTRSLTEEECQEHLHLDACSAP